MFIDVRTLCNYLNVKKSTIYSWVNQGLIPHYKLCGGPVRFKLNEIEEWVNRFKIDPEIKKKLKGGPIKQGNTEVNFIIRRAIDENSQTKV